MFIHRAGQLDMSTALGLTAYLDREREYVPWSSALSHLGFIGSMLSMRPSYGFYRVSSLTPVNLESNGAVFTKATPNKRRKVEAPVETKEIKFLILFVYCFLDKKKWKETTSQKRFLLAFSPKKKKTTSGILGTVTMVNGRIRPKRLKVFQPIRDRHTLIWINNKAKKINAICWF